MKALLSLAGILAAVTVSDAHTAANDVGATRAGSGGGSISGYAVSGISYELVGDRISSVSFSLDPPGAGTVRIRLSPAGSWRECSVFEGEAVCDVPEIDVADLARLDVVASS